MSNNTDVFSFTTYDKERHRYIGRHSMYAQRWKHAIADMVSKLAASLKRNFVGLSTSGPLFSTAIRP